MQEREFIDRIKSLVPLLEQHAEEAEHLRKPVDAVMKAIEDAGTYRYFVPKAYGGHEFSLEGFMDLGMALGEGCLSTAWVVTFCMEHNWLLGLYDKAAQDDIFGRQAYIIAPGALAPKGKAEPVEGGFVINGRWEWGTGVMHADWVMVGALTPSDDPQRPDLCMYVIPREQVEVIDTWHMAGMVGTGSNDIAVRDVFVPGHRRVNLMALRSGDSPGASLHDSATFRMPMLPVLGLTAAAPAVGAARKAVALFRERLQGRTVYGTSTRQGERGVSQVRLGHLQAAVTETEVQLLALASEVSRWGESGEPCPELERAALRVRIGRVVRAARDIVRDVVEASGAHAHFLSNPLQRTLRDVHTLSCHTVFDLDISSENYGRLLLGLSANSPV